MNAKQMMKHIEANKTEIKNAYDAVLARRDLVESVSNIVSTVFAKIFEKHDFPINPEYVDILELDNAKCAEHVAFMCEDNLEELAQVYISKVSKYEDFVKLYPNYADLGQAVLFLTPNMYCCYDQEIALLRLFRNDNNKKFEDDGLRKREIEIIGDILRKM